MKCREARQLFYPWLDGELSGRQQAELQEHLRECPACAGELAGWMAVSSTLKGMAAEVMVPEGFTAGVMNRLLESLSADMPAAAVAGERPAAAGSLAGAVAGGGMERYVASAHEKAPGVPGAGRARWAPARWWQGLSHSWRRGVAAAAAAVLLLAGSAGFAARQWWPPAGIPGPAVLAQNPGDGSPVYGGDGGGTGREAPPAEQGGPQDAGTPAAPPDTGAKQGGPGADGRVPAGNSAGSSRPETGNGQAAPGGESGKIDQQDGTAAGGDARAGNSAALTPRVFLNQPRSIESTLLKVQVADLAAAGKTLLAEAAGLPYQSFGRQQVDGHTVEILRFVVPAERASSFTAVAAGLGRVVDRQNSRQDISQQFAASLDHYRDLIARRNNAGSDGEKADLDRQIRELEQQLSTWDTEAGRQVVVVWLQQ